MAEERQDRFRILFEQSMDAIYIGTLEGEVIDVNQSWLDLFGYSQEDLPSIKATDLYVDPSVRVDLLQRIVERGAVKDEILARRKDGSAFLCQRSLVAQRDADGTVVAIQGVNRDVSALRATEEALRDRELRYRSLFEQSMDPIYITAPDGSSIEVNPAWLDLFGYSREDVATLNAIDVYADPANRAEFLRLIEVDGFVRDQVRLKRKDGTVFDAERTVVPVKDISGNVTAYQGIIHDISERKRAEDALRRSEAYSSSIVAVIPDLIIRINADGELVDVVAASDNKLAMPRDEAAGKSIADILSKDDAVRAEKAVRESLRTSSLQSMEYQLEMPSGKRWFEARFSPSGPREVVAFIRDITDRKRAEDALRESEERFRTLFEQSRDAIYLGTPAGTITDANQAWLDLFGYTRDELSHITAEDMYANPADRKSFLRRITRTGHVTDEVRFKKKDGTQFDCERTSVAMRDAGQVVTYQGLMRDVSQMKRARAELEHLAHFDTLTGLLNRRAILAKLDEWLRHSKRYEVPLSIAMVDIDHFKQVNDLHGHLVGDRVLADTADALRKSVRLTDYVGRYGGEEFLLILPQTDATGALAVAERARSLVMGTTMVDSEGGTLSVTVSIGVAEWCGGDDEDVLVSRADAALYRAKGAGRNRVETALCPGNS